MEPWKPRMMGCEWEFMKGNGDTKSIIFWSNIKSLKQLTQGTNKKSITCSLNVGDSVGDLEGSPGATVSTGWLVGGFVRSVVSFRKLPPPLIKLNLPCHRAFLISLGRTIWIVFEVKHTETCWFWVVPVCQKSKIIPASGCFCSNFRFRRDDLWEIPHMPGYWRCSTWIDRNA